MPVLVTKPNTGTRDYTTYKLYRKSEIKNDWPFFKTLHLRKMSNDTEPYVSCVVEDEESAVILIALLMRRTGAIPVNFYYDDESKRLLANCVVPRTDAQEIRKQFLDVLDILLLDPNLKTLVKDPVGNSLFKTDEKPVQGTYEGPASPEQIPWTGHDNLHKHCSALEGMGINMMGNLR